MSMFSTKYALSSGIREFTPEKVGDSEYVWDGPYSMLRIGRDAFSNIEDAMADAEKRRVKKIASLRKQIKALESMEFVATGATP